MQGNPHVRFTRAVGPHMLQRRSGKVINIGSWTPHQGGRDMVLYTTAKTALAGFTRAQVLEWAPMACMSMPSPPAFFPDVVTSGEERMRQAIQRAEQTVPLKRPGKLREVGFLALYLASAASDYMTGQTILLDAVCRCNRKGKLPRWNYARRASRSISTSAPRARPVTPTQVRAGRRPGTK